MHEEGVWAFGSPLYPSLHTSAMHHSGTKSTTRRMETATQHHRAHPDGTCDTHIRNIQHRPPIPTDMQGNTVVQKGAHGMGCRHNKTQGQANSLYGRALSRPFSANCTQKTTGQSLVSFQRRTHQTEADRDGGAPR